MEQLRVQRELQRVNRTMYPVFNEEKTRKLLAPLEGTPITQHSWQRFDGSVWIVTQLSLADLGICTFKRGFWVERGAGQPER